MILATLAEALWVGGGLMAMLAFALIGLVRLEIREKAKAEADPDSEEYRINTGRRLPPPPRPPRNPNTLDRSRS